ncbi:zinc-binding dehydrogenase [Chryseobacterium indoltheticum]|nr:zinc-binding dehydrogenase [Chryseobacterium indoltheticum]
MVWANTNISIIRYRNYSTNKDRHLFKTFPFTEAVEAHRLLDDGSHTGKIILLR